MEGSVRFTRVAPRDTVSTLAFLQRERDEARHNGRVGWIAACVLLLLLTIVSVMAIAQHASASDVRPDPCASAISRALSGGHPDSRSSKTLGSGKSCCADREDPGPHFRGARPKGVRT